jgi:FXSXX-COOH protein
MIGPSHMVNQRAWLVFRDAKGSFMLESGDRTVDRAADAELPDVGDYSLAAILQADDSALARVARRVPEQSGQSFYAAHGSVPTPL